MGTVTIWPIKFSLEVIDSVSALFLLFEYVGKFFTNK